LEIEVYGHDDLSQNVVVSPDGAVAFPLLGSIQVASLSTSDIAELIRADLEKDFLVNPHVTVTVTRHRSQPVQVIGAVKEPGVRYLKGETTLREFLTQYGWVDPEKTSGDIVVRRASGESISILVSELEAGIRDLPVLPFDSITAPEGQFVYVDGEVGKPGAVRFQDGLTVLQALTHAGGPSDLAKLRNAQILRDGKTIPVNIKKVQAGREADFEMRPGDQLHLKESPI
jgi:polysaccharide export outer membrane protein